MCYTKSEGVLGDVKHWGGLFSHIIIIIIIMMKSYVTLNLVIYPVGWLPIYYYILHCVCDEQL